MDRRSKGPGALLACATAISLIGIVPLAHAETVWKYTPIGQTGMKAVATDSVETTGEGANGPIEKVLDGDSNTYWHTKWETSVDQLPHWFVIDLGKEVANLAQVTLTPRQSSNSSGRVGQYQVDVSTDAKCAAADTLAQAAFTKVAEGSIDVGVKAADALLNFGSAVSARCVKVTYLSSWGGNDQPEEVASLAEFNAATGVSKEVDDPEPGEGPQIVVPKGALTITDGQLTVRTHPDFPQVVDYQLGGKVLAGKYGEALNSATVNGTAVKVTVGTAKVSDDNTSVTYPLTFAGFEDVTVKAVMSLKDQVLTYRLVIDDDGKKIQTIEIPDLDLVSFNGKDEAAQIMAATIQTSRTSAGDDYVPGDKLVNVHSSSAIAPTYAYMVAAANSDLAAGFETNAISGTNTSARLVYRVQTGVEGQNVGTISPAPWTYWAPELISAGATEIGPDATPMIQVKITDDANQDQVMDWQDGAIATRDVLTPSNGSDSVKNLVITRIPFNIVSQATHPFLRTLDDTKRISLETDNLGQQALLKGYQAEGHDSAQGDYGNHFNERAGGLQDLKTLANVSKQYNTTLGIHVNATESYSEANCFADDANGYEADKVAAPCELSMPPGKAWGWMNQAYYMNRVKDLGTGNLLKRLEQLRADFGVDSNLNWLYWDVYYGTGWEAQRFATEVSQQGWRLSSEWAYSMPTMSTWSHWATDENYGGQANKGLNSHLIRFVENAHRDTFNPDPMLGNVNIKEFEGWVGQNNHTNFIKNVWERNLPTKFLQQSDIMSWTPAASGTTGQIKFANGTVVTSDVQSIDGVTIPTDREITYDGATVYQQGSYLLPWSDGGTERLYYWNPGNQAATWELTNAWESQTSLTLYKLTDTGRQEVGKVTVANGRINLPATDAATAYVLYPTSKVPQAQVPNWGEGSHISDPGFFSGTLDSYQVQGQASVVKTERQNYQARLASGDAASLAQQVNLPAGDYSMWAWVEIERGKERQVTVSVSGSGVKATNYQTSVEGIPTSMIHSSAVMNATASDEKLRTYFQRVPVFFHTDGQPITFKVAAAKGQATVDIDDLRVVEYADMAGNDENKSDETIFFTDFEDTDNGYWPFVTGADNAGGDARTQLAKLHAPYSQAGWWGVVEGKVTEGQKYLDNVLDGNWSLLAHQENSGVILRTAEGSFPLEQGNTYRVSFDYQSAFDDDYTMVLGHDVAGTDGDGNATWSQAIDERWPLAMTRGKAWTGPDGAVGEGTKTFVKQFVVGEHPTFLGIQKSGSKDQGDLVIDNVRIERLGILPVTSIKAQPQESDSSAMRQVLVTTTIAVPQGAESKATGVTHELQVPQGWTKTSVTSGETSVKAGTAGSVATWAVTMPKNANPGDLVFTGSWTFAGKDGQDTKTLQIDPGNFPLINPIGGSDLVIEDFSSEQVTGEPEPSGPAAAAIDGNLNTYWHTAWSPSSAQYPHHIVLRPKVATQQASAQCTMTGFEYTGRQNQENGRAKGYEIYVSKDGNTWGEPVKTGQFADVSTAQVIEFDQSVEGTYLKLVELDAQNGEAFGGAAELRIGGVCTTRQEGVTPDPSQTVTPQPAQTMKPAPSKIRPGLPNTGA